MVCAYSAAVGILPYLFCFDDAYGKKFKKTCMGTSNDIGIRSPMTITVIEIIGVHNMAKRCNSVHRDRI